MSTLPSPETSQMLADTYFELQRDHWPSLANLLGKRSPITTEAVTGHQSNAIPVVDYRSLREHSGRIGAAYVRANILDVEKSSVLQLTAILRTAASEQVFVPWNYIFADVASGAGSAVRPDLQRLLTGIRDRTLPVSHVIVDSFDRLSREQQQFVELTKYLKQCGTRLITTDRSKSAVM